MRCTKITGQISEGRFITVMKRNIGKGFPLIIRQKKIYNTEVDY